MNEEARKRSAQARLNSIVHELKTGEPLGQLRTHLDEWAAFEIGGELLTRGDRQRWFNNPCPWKHWDRLPRYMDWVTPSAADILKRGEDRDPAVRKPPSGQPAPYRLVVDHAVPIAEIRRLLVADESLWEASKLRGFLRYHFRRGVLTKNEDNKLRSQGLGSRMPVGWKAWDDPFARYRAVNLERHIYEHGK
jgi:hypothetical protein